MVCIILSVGQILQLLKQSKHSANSCAGSRLLSLGASQLRRDKRKGVYNKKKTRISGFASMP